MELPTECREVKPAEMTTSGFSDVKKNHVVIGTQEAACCTR